MRLFNPLILLCALVLAGCSGAGTPADALDTAQYAWSGAIRWGDFTGARNLVDAEVQAKRPLTDLEIERYSQIQVSSYRDVGASRNIEAGTAARDIEIGVINRHTMAERTVKYRETWRWDADSKTWWLTSDLPDLWAGR